MTERIRFVSVTGDKSDIDVFLGKCKQRDSFEFVNCKVIDFNQLADDYGGYTHFTVEIQVTDNGIDFQFFRYPMPLSILKRISKKFPALKFSGYCLSDEDRELSIFTIVGNKMQLSFYSGNDMFYVLFS